MTTSANFVRFIRNNVKPILANNKEYQNLKHLYETNKDKVWELYDLYGSPQSSKLLMTDINVSLQLLYKAIINTENTMSNLCGHYRDLIGEWEKDRKELIEKLAQKEEKTKKVKILSSKDKKEIEELKTRIKKVQELITEKASFSHDFFKLLNKRKDLEKEMEESGVNPIQIECQMVEIERGLVKKVIAENIENPIIEDTIKEILQEEEKTNSEDRCSAPYHYTILAREELEDAVNAMKAEKNLVVEDFINLMSSRDIQMVKSKLNFEPENHEEELE